ARVELDLQAGGAQARCGLGLHPALGQREHQRRAVGGLAHASPSRPRRPTSVSRKRAPSALASTMAAAGHDDSERTREYPCKRSSLAAASSRDSTRPRPPSAPAAPSPAAPSTRPLAAASSRPKPSAKPAARGKSAPS